MNLTSIFKKVVWSGVGKNNSKNRNKTFFNKKMQVFKKVAAKIGSHSNINVEVHVRTNFKMFPDKFC